MARKNQLDSSLSAIEFFFDNSTIKSFSENKFREFFAQKKSSWKVPINRYSKQVLKYLLNKELLFENVFFDNSNQQKIIYSWKTQDEYTVINGLKSNSYFAYYSAIYLHQLSLQIPKSIYLNFEHKSNNNYSSSDFELTQEAIDNAFNGSQRKSSITYSYIDKKIILTNGKFTDKLGVAKRVNNEQCFEYTDIERTLIDISVRPVYAGGVFEVLEAFKLAKEILNVAKMADYLDSMDFIYPYHQVIGFYLERAGYSENDLSFFF